MNKKLLEFDFCVIGGGLSGMLAAISAARHNLKTILIQDRPMLGGNASSEIRMWPLGCKDNYRETGIFEEILLENMYRNPFRNPSIWDSVLYEKIVNEPNIFLLLNTSCLDLKMNGNSIESVTAWQLTTYKFFDIRAKYFADCSGDSILALNSGAEYRFGREASGEFGEDIQPAAADNKTMGASCLIQARKTNRKSEFIPPSWAKKLKEEDLAFRPHNLEETTNNFWWLELGGNHDKYEDCESARHELLALAFGVWNHIKQNHDADFWELEWVGFLPGKRESIRYVGDYILNQNDVRAGGNFEDTVAYGGWSMDDHHPDGFHHKGEPTVYHPAPPIFGIPYRCLYSKNIDNLFFAGRNISVTHAALSATRVMATCALLGQAVGTAASLCHENNLSPRGIYETKIHELQTRLMFDDCYIPFQKRNCNELTSEAIIKSSDDSDIIRNGYDRPVGMDENIWEGKKGDSIEFSFGEFKKINKIRLIFDSDLCRNTISGGIPGLYKHPTLNHYVNNMPPFTFPTTIAKEFEIQTTNANGEWESVKNIENNYQRLLKIDVNLFTKNLRIVFRNTWGCENIRVFAIDIE